MSEPTYEFLFEKPGPALLRGSQCVRTPGQRGCGPAAVVDNQGPGRVGQELRSGRDGRGRARRHICGSAGLPYDAGSLK